MPLGIDADGTPFDEPLEYYSVVGMLAYLSRNSRPDIHSAVRQCARLTQNPRRSHSEEVKRTFHYLVGTQGKCLTFNPNSDMKLDCYVDADFAGLWKHKDDQDSVFVKSSTGYVMTLVGCPLYWV